MPTTVEGLLVIALALLPGAVYTWGFERQAGSFGVSFADRSLRFVAVSAVFHLAAAWPEYLLWRVILSGKDDLLSGQFFALWVTALLLTAIPYAVGTALGGLYSTRGSREGWTRIRSHLTDHQEERLLAILLGPAPAPRAWDHLFSERKSVYLRIQTTDENITHAGRFAANSHAGGFPQPADLYLEEAFDLLEDGAIGESLGYPIYIPADQIAWLEVVPQQDEVEPGAEGPTAATIDLDAHTGGESDAH